jgi:TP901 family phage tail tape measure protein
MADVNANIGVNIDTSNALAQLKALQRQLSQFHTSVARSSETASLAQKSMQKNFVNSVNAIGSFSAELRTVKTTTESFTSSLEGNKFSMREYFRYAGGATKTFGRLFKSEFDTIGKVAEERVKTLQTQYVKLGRNASGAMEAIAIRPTSLNMKDLGTQTAIAAQKQALFNQLIKQGSTNLLNFGKNTQWAGRQLMVGFTLPLAMVGSAATKTFMDMEAQAIKFKKVYGDLFTPKEETQQALDNITELGRQFTKYGIAVSTTVGLAAEAAAAGFSGLDLQRQTTEATRLSILGQIDTQKALETTISLQNAFGMSSDKLADSINFLNAVENQTVVSLDDITTAIPKVAPVIQQLGGDVKDLTFFLAAMKEGGINASEGANALKSGLAALINPTGRASAMLKGFGINATEIVTKNKGNLKATVVEFATALNQLDPLNRAQAIEQMFGKFQFARLSTLFANVAKDGNQAARVLDLANSSVEDLSALSEQELGMTADSAMNKFKKTVEDLKFALIPIGKAFLEAVTPILEFVNGILSKFADLSEGTKKAITVMVTVIGALGPILLMTFGLLANGVANIIKLFLTLRNGYLRLTGQSRNLGEQTQYLTTEQMEAAAASHSLNQAHAMLTQQFTVEAGAVNQLAEAYRRAITAGNSFASMNPGSMLPRRKGYASGVVSVPGSGNKDTVPAMLTPGEAVIPADMAKKYGPLISGMVAGNIPGYNDGKDPSGGFKKVKVPGAMNLAHFGEKGRMTGQQLLDMVAGLETAAAKEIENLVNSIENGVRQTFKVFNNMVIAQLDTINNSMDKDGKANLNFVKENIVGDSFAPVRDVELQRQLEEANVPLEDIKKINQELTDNMKEGFTKLGDATEITSDQLDNLIREAYEAVAKTDKRVAKAYQNMQQVSSMYAPVTEKGKRSRRISITGDSYIDHKAKTKQNPDNVYRRGQERMVGADNVPYPKLSDFGINQEMIKGLDLTVEQAQAKFKELSNTTKIELAKLAGNSKEFAIAFKSAIDDVERSGTALGRAAITSIGKGAKTASPSKDTIRTGEDVGKGLEIGMQSRKDEVAAVGTSLGTTATRNVQRGASTGVITPGSGFNISKTQYGLTAGQIAANAPSSGMGDQSKKQADAISNSTNRLRSFDRNIMGASFAISSLSGLASMSGGKLGQMSGGISKVTGAMFALQAVTGLLTQANVLELATKRANNIATLMGASGFKSLFTKSAGLGKNLATAGKFAWQFAGKASIAIGVITAGVSLIRYINAARERERLAIEGLADAMTLASGKVKMLATLLGETPTARAGSGARVGANQLTADERTKVDTLRADKDFLKTYKNDIESIRTASAKEAAIAFAAIALDLGGQGISKDGVKAYIDALGEEAGRTEVSLKFKAIDLSTEEGRSAALKLAKDTQKEFDKAFKGGVNRKTLARSEFSGTSVRTVLSPGDLDPTKKQQKALNETSAVLANTFAALTAEFGNQTIKADEYNKQMSLISETIPKGNEGMLLMDKILVNLSPEISKASKGIKDYDTQMLLLRAALVNASIAENIFQDLLSKNPAKVAAAKKALQEYKIATDALAPNVVTPNDYVPPTSTETKEKSPFQKAKEDLMAQRKELENTRVAYGKLKSAGIESGRAFELAKDSILAAALATTKVGTEKWKTLLGLIKKVNVESKKTPVTVDGLKQNLDDESSKASEYFSAQEALITSQRQAGADAIQSSIDSAEAAIEQAQSKIDAQQAFIDSNNESIDKLNRQIEMDYDRPIQALNDEASILQNNLTLIDKQSEAINLKYDKQADALTKVSEINADIANQQKQQIGLADALSRGDISAAASAAQDIRATEAASRVSGVKDSLEVARKQELDGLISGGLTREQIEKRLFDIGQQTFTLEQSRKLLQAEVLVLQDSNYKYELEINKIKKDSLIPSQKLLDDANKALETYTKATQSQIDSLRYLELTSKEWENNKIKADAAYQSIKAIEASIKASVDAARELMALLSAAEAKKTAKPKLGQTPDEINAIIAENLKLSDAEQIKQFGGLLLKPGSIPNTDNRFNEGPDAARWYQQNKSMGGLIQKYFAAGGLALGTDIVPAMLTPGEFVMSKYAVESNGLNKMKAINNGDSIGDSVYNYSISVNVKSDADANEIARSVITQIKNIDSQKLRGTRI